MSYHHRMNPMYGIRDIFSFFAGLFLENVLLNFPFEVLFPCNSYTCAPFRSPAKTCCLLLVGVLLPSSSSTFSTCSPIMQKFVWKN